MPQGDDKASAMKEALEHTEDAVITDLDTTKVLKPCVGALDFPASSITAQLAFVLERPANPAPAIRYDQFRSPTQQASPQSIGIIPTVGNHSLQPLPRTSASGTGYSHPRQRAFREPKLGDLRGRKLRSDRYALAVDHHHALRTFPATGLAHGRAPFFAITKVASRKASSQSRSLRSSRRASSACQARNHTPSSSHRRRRRQQVEPSGNWAGRSRHRAPTRRTQRMPSKQLRFDAHGRPRPSRRRLGSGNKSSICFHCWSLSIPTANRNQAPVLKYLS